MILDEPVDTWYNEQTCLAFNFSVQQSNASWITEYPLIVPAYVPYNIIPREQEDTLSSIPLVQNQTLNLTGYADVDGNFIVTKVSLANMEWIDTLKNLWETIGNVGKGLVTLIVQVVEALTGVQLPEWTVSLILVGMLSFTFLRLGRKLPMIFVVVMFFICIALISHLMTNLQLQL